MFILDKASGLFDNLPTPPLSVALLPIPLIHVMPSRRKSSYLLDRQDGTISRFRFGVSVKQKGVVCSFPGEVIEPRLPIVQTPEGYSLYGVRVLAEQGKDLAVAGYHFPGLFFTLCHYANLSRTADCGGTSANQNHRRQDGLDYLLFFASLSPISPIVRQGYLCNTNSCYRKQQY